MKNIQKLLFLAVCLCTALTVKAQNLTVIGKVIDSEGLEVIGANITLKGTPGVGAISDLSGNYKIHPFTYKLWFLAYKIYFLSGEKVIQL